MCLNGHIRKQQREHRRQQQMIQEQLKQIRIEVNSLIYFIVLNGIRNAQSSEERRAVLECWEKVSAVSLGKGKGEGKAEGEGETKGPKAQSTRARQSADRRERASETSRSSDKAAEES